MPKIITIPINTNELCVYGCGNIAKFKGMRTGKLICEESSNKCEANKTKNSNSVKLANATGKRKPPIYKDFPEETKRRMNWNKNNHKADFTYDGKGSHKIVLIKERGHKCESCGLSEWLCEPIPLELEHKDGDNRNQTKENLLILCPNCHAKTKFYRGRNKNNGKLKATDEQILIELSKGLTNRQVLIAVGLTPKGGNYERVNRLRYSVPLAQLEEASDLSSDQCQFKSDRGYQTQI